METYILSLPGQPVETLRGHLNFLVRANSAGYSVLRLAYALQ